MPFHNAHLRVDRAADEGFGDAVAFQHFALAFRGRAAVAAHRGKNEGIGAERLQLGNYGLHAHRDIRDAPAAAAHCDLHPGFDARPDFRPRELIGDCERDVGDPGCHKLLANAQHPRQRDIQAARDVDVDTITDHFMILPLPARQIRSRLMALLRWPSRHPPRYRNAHFSPLPPICRARKRQLTVLALESCVPLSTRRGRRTPGAGHRMHAIFV
jgi:hypothetical protein